MRHGAIVAVAVAALVGCATPPTRTVFTPAPPGVAEAPAGEPSVPPQVFHVVQKGETLYRIALTYGVTVEELVRANGIADPTRIEIGQRLLIPSGAVAPRPAPPGESVSSEAIAGWGWPLDGPVSSRFGARSHDSWHSGVDITAPKGSAVLAAKDGEVTFAGRQGRYGQLVILNHGADLTSWYAHLDRIFVEVGRRVRRGEKIGAVGVTGNATGSHLHFEIRREGRPVDPAPFLP